MASTKNTKKSPTKKASTKRTPSRAKPTYKHFKLQKNDEPFFTFRLSLQSLYWTVLVLFVSGLAGWIISLQLSINSIYDRIDQDQQLSNQINELDKRVLDNRRAINGNKQTIQQAAPQQ